MVIGNRLAATGYRFADGVQVAYRLAKAQIDVVFGPELGSAKPEAVFFHLAQQIGLGERRALVGRGGLVAQHHDLSIVTEGPQLCCQRRTGLACPDDHHFQH
jgi:hypothetical protein